MIRAPGLREIPGEEHESHLLQTHGAELERLFAPEQISATQAKLQAEVDCSLVKLGLKPANNSLLEGDAAKPRASG